MGETRTALIPFIYSLQDPTRCIWQTFPRCQNSSRGSSLSRLVSGFICSCAVRTTSWNGEPKGSVWTDRSETLLGGARHPTATTFPVDLDICARCALKHTGWQGWQNGLLSLTLRRLRLSVFPVSALFRWGSTISHALLRCFRLLLLSSPGDMSTAREKFLEWSCLFSWLLKSLEDRFNCIAEEARGKIGASIRKFLSFLLMSLSGHQVLP